MNGQQVGRVRHLVELCRWNDARRLLAPLLASDPDSADLHELDAEICGGLGDPDGRLRASRRAAALAPHRENPHRTMAYAHHELGDHAAAYAAACESRRLSPHHWATHVTVAMMASLLDGHQDEAKAAAAQAIELSPGTASTHFAAGFAAQGRGRRRQARAHYRRALGIDPQHSEALTNLVTVSGWGRPGGAMRGYSRALRIDPQNEVAAANIQAVATILLRRVAVLAVISIYAGVLLTGLGLIAVNPASRVAGWLVVAAIVVLVGAFAPGCTRPVRATLRRGLCRLWEFWAVLVLIGAALACGLTFCWVDGVAHAACRWALLPWLMLVLPVRTAIKRRLRARRANRG